jgi:hypothetical protein
MALGTFGIEIYGRTLVEKISMENPAYLRSNLGHFLFF